MDLMARIYKGRIDCLRDDDRPCALLVGGKLLYLLKQELTPRVCDLSAKQLTLMGMAIEESPTELLSIRTEHGDIRRI